MVLQDGHWMKNTLFRVFFDFMLMSRFIHAKSEAGIGQDRPQKLAKRPG
jgi:hypothetical protein